MLDLTRLRRELRDLGRELWEVSRVKRVAVASHPSADPDSISSALSVSLIALRSSGKPACLVTEGGLDLISKPLFQNMVSKGYIEECPERVDSDAWALVLVDTPSCSRSPVECGVFRDIYIIDHHISPEQSLGARGIIEGNASSTTELCTLMLEELSIEISPSDAANMILAGILYDTRSLSIASLAAIEATRFLMMHGARIQDALKLIKRPLEVSERIARLKSMSRLTAYRSGDNVLVCITHVGAYEASSAQVLMGAGCDIALVLSEKDDLVRVVARCSEEVCRETGLGELVLGELAEIYRGGWGGHRLAAVASVKAALDDVLKTIPRILEKRLGRLSPI